MWLSVFVTRSSTSDINVSEHHQHLEEDTHANYRPKISVFGTAWPWVNYRWCVYITGSVRPGPGRVLWPSG